MIDYFRPSPHYNERPENIDVNLLVIHNISLPSGLFAGPWIDDLFMGRLDINAHPSFIELNNLRVSSHLLIQRNGFCTQYVPFEKRAWHAGESCWNGEENCNDFSIGIELEGTDNQAFTEQQYQKLRTVILAISKQYPLIQKNLCGHSDIAPGRKTDPGVAFDWAYLSSLISH